MDVLALMGEMATRLTAAGIRTAPIGSDTMVPPSPASAMIYMPERIDYDQTASRGLVKTTDIVLVVFVAGTTRRTAPARLGPYMIDTGTKSIKKLIDTTAAVGYTNAFDVQVIYSEIDYSAKMDDVDYIAALFHINAFGSGA
jgi:hypothetical protein